MFTLSLGGADVRRTAADGDGDAEGNVDGDSGLMTVAATDGWSPTSRMSMPPPAIMMATEARTKGMRVLTNRPTGAAYQG
jgi:hypothetical protein